MFTFSLGREDLWWLVGLPLLIVVDLFVTKIL